MILGRRTVCRYEMIFAYGLLLRGSGACTINPNLHALGASRATLQLPPFSLMAPRRPYSAERER